MINHAAIDSDLLEVYLNYLNDLRESGLVNMYFAPKALIAVFGLDKAVAQAVAHVWRESFRED